MVKRSAGGCELDNKIPEVEELSKLTLKASEIMLSGVKQLLVQFNEQRTLESLAAFADEKSNLFQGCARLLECGFFLCEGSQTGKEVLARTVSFRQSIATLVSSTNNDVAKFSEAERFTFIGQMLNAEWIVEPMRSAMKDEEWCNQMNATLRETLPGLISTGNTVNSLKATLQNRLQKITSVFKEKTADADAFVDGGKGTKIQGLAHAFAKGGTTWLSTDEFMELACVTLEVLCCNQTAMRATMPTQF